MYLINTNIFLEILLEQEKADECEDFLDRIQDKDLFRVSSFTLHSIEVIMERNKHIEKLSEFLSFVATSKISRLETDTNDELQVLEIMKKFKLDFDDSMQLYLCQKHKLKIISYEQHFDKTPIKRVEPKHIEL